MATPGRGANVAAPGLAQFRRDLAKVSKDLRKGVDKHIREIAAKVRADARTNAPKRSGRLARSIRYSLRSRGASIYSNEEYAGVHEFGGEIQPKGTPIQIEGTAYMARARDDNTEFIEDELGRLVDVIADNNGFQ